MPAILLSIGDELTLGQTVDTNAAWLSAQLASRGIDTLRHETVPDDRPAIVDAIARAADQADLLIATGGLGPTDDDLTRFALADVMGVALELDPSALHDIDAFFRGRGKTMNRRNRVQAMCPVGATLLANPAGTAPGIHVRLGKNRPCDAYFVPGVPREMHALWDQHIAPALPAAGRTILTARLNTFGKGESDVAAMLGELMARDRNPLVGTTVSAGIVSARIRSTFDHADEARRQLDATIQRVEAALGELVFSRDEVELAPVVGERLKARRQTVATAESCTGGLVAQMLTAVPGSSDYYPGGWICYANEMKQQLGVAPDLIAEHGAVSEPVAQALADAAARRAHADYALATTGIAGPTGGTDAKPVGTVCFGLATPDGASASTHIFPGDRATVRHRAALHALNTLRLALA